MKKLTIRYTLKKTGDDHMIELNIADTVTLENAIAYGLEFFPLPRHKHDHSKAELKSVYITETTRNDE